MISIRLNFNFPPLGNQKIGSMMSFTIILIEKDFYSYLQPLNLMEYNAETTNLKTYTNSETDLSYLQPLNLIENNFLDNTDSNQELSIETDLNLNAEIELSSDVEKELSVGKELSIEKDLNLNTGIELNSNTETNLNFNEEIELSSNAGTDVNVNGENDLNLNEEIELNSNVETNLIEPALELENKELNGDYNRIDTEPELVKLSKKSIEKNAIELCIDGVGGTYFIKNDEGKKIGVFKPCDEEPGALNNPKKLMDDPLMPPGGGAIREVAVYMLDKGFASVPETHFLDNVNSKIFHSGHHISKSGSIQRFVDNIGDTTSIGATFFSKDDVHKIGILDIRIMNMDRNDENMLVRKEGNKYGLIPIDHAYTFPPTLDNVYFGWMYWRQAKEQFSKESLEYISNIDIRADEEILRSVGIEEISIRTMKISTRVLKKGASAGLNLFQIASIVSRKRPNVKSELEEIVEIADNSENFEQRFDELLDKLVLSKL